MIRADPPQLAGPPLSSDPNCVASVLTGRVTPPRRGAARPLAGLTIALGPWPGAEPPTYASARARAVPC